MKNSFRNGEAMYWNDNSSVSQVDEHSCSLAGLMERSLGIPSYIYSSIANGVREARGVVHK